MRGSRESSSQPERNRSLIAREISRRRTRLRSVPDQIQLGIEHRCNLRCIMCVSTAVRRHGGVPIMDRRLRENIPDLLRKLEPCMPSWRKVELTGTGEILLSPVLPEILESFRRRGIATTFATNGMLLDRRRAEMIVGGGVAELTFSIGAATKETYERMRVGASWEKLLESIALLREVKRERGSAWPGLRFEGNFLRMNIEELPGLVDLAAEQGAAGVWATPTIVYDERLADQDLRNFPELAREMTAEAARRAAARGIEFWDWITHAVAGEPSPAARPIGEAATPADGRVAGAAACVPTAENARAAAEALSTPPDPCGPGRSPAVAAAAGPQVPADSSPAGQGLGGERECLAAVAGSAFAVGEGEPPAGRSPGVLSWLVQGGMRRGGRLARRICRRAVPLPARRRGILAACELPWSGLTLWSDGTARVCCGESPVLGNLNHTTFAELWNGRPAQALRRAFLEDRPPEKCRLCPVYLRSGQPGPPAAATLASLDTLADDQAVRGTWPVLGWALDPQGVRGVHVIVDGEVVGPAALGMPRPDVAQVHPAFPEAARPGFSFLLDTTAWEDGYHLLWCRIHRGGGEPVEACHSTLRILNRSPEADAGAGPDAGPREAIDEPAEGATLGGTVGVCGWALHPLAVAALEILVDGRPAGLAEYGLERLDVALAHPTYPDCHRSGFSFLLDTQGLEEGEHILALRILDGRGGRCEVGRRQVYIDHSR